jgi:hypothetical protein
MNIYELRNFSSGKIHLAFYLAVDQKLSENKLGKREESVKELLIHLSLDHISLNLVSPHFFFGAKK